MFDTGDPKIGIEYEIRFIPGNQPYLLNFIFDFLVFGIACVAPPTHLVGKIVFYLYRVNVNSFLFVPASKKKVSSILKKLFLMCSGDMMTLVLLLLLRYRFL